MVRRNTCTASSSLVKEACSLLSYKETITNYKYSLNKSQSDSEVVECLLTINVDVLAPLVKFNTSCEAAREIWHCSVVCGHLCFESVDFERKEAGHLSAQLQLSLHSACCFRMRLAILHHVLVVF